MTDRTFIWITGKSSRKAHIMNPETERTYCQTENVRRKKSLDGKGPEKPPGDCYVSADYTAGGGVRA